MPRLESGDGMPVGTCSNTSLNLWAAAALSERAVCKSAHKRLSMHRRRYRSELSSPAASIYRPFCSRLYRWPTREAEVRRDGHCSMEAAADSLAGVNVIQYV